jgi:ubiquitin-conjugating enzyme E2 C
VLGRVQIHIVLPKGILVRHRSSPCLVRIVVSGRCQLTFIRLQTELMQLMTSPAPGISAFPSADGNLLSWTATIEGPDDTPYSGLIFKLNFAFPSNYPYAPPTVLFKTPIYHPNVDFSGRICLDILKDKWTAAYNIQTVLLSLQSLLGEPNKCVVPVILFV